MKNYSLIFKCCFAIDMMMRIRAKNCSKGGFFKDEKLMDFCSMLSSLLSFFIKYSHRQVKKRSKENAFHFNPPYQIIFNKMFIVREREIV